MSEEKRDRTVIIDAKAEREFEPDLFKLSIDFYGERNERKLCVEAYNADFAKVKAALVNSGIEPGEIKSSEFRVITHFDWLYEKDEDYSDYYRRVKRLIDGYEYRGDCSVECKTDNELLKRIWAALQEIDGGFSFEIDYRLERPDECEKAILREAVAEARSRAETLAIAAGAKLGDVVTIHHRFDNASMSYGACAPCDSECLGALPSFVPEFNPEAIEVGCSVSVAWAIE